MKKISLVLLATLALPLMGCNFSFSDGDSPSRKVVNFSIADNNIDKYYSNSIYNESNDLIVYAIRQNGTSYKISKSEYSYEVYDSSNQLVDTSLPFGNSGDYYVEVEYSTFGKKKLDFNVKEFVSVTSITLNTSSLELNKGQTYQFSASIEPSTATNKEINWYSSDETVAKIDQTGLVTAKGAGSTTITATTVDGSFTASCNLTVIIPIFEKVDLLYDYDDVKDNNFYTVDNTPLNGSPKIAIIPIWFNDSSSYISSDKKESVKTDIYNSFALNGSSKTGWYSVADYYKEESSGLLTMDFTISDWYEVNKNSSDFTTSSDTVELVKTVTNWYFKDRLRTDYDTNKDGFLDGMMLIYAAPDYRTLDNESLDNLWAYCYYVQSLSANVVNPNPNVFFWASYDFLYGNNATSKTGHNYGGGDTSHCLLDTHTYIHETGHMLGLTDYYDYSDNKYEISGAFSMQDYNVGGHEPFSLMSLGWVDPYVPNESCVMTLKPFQSSHDVILLKNNFTSKSPFDEYLLLELYTPTGLNAFDSTYQYSGRYPLGPSKTGIRLWHVDARLVKASNYAGGCSINNITTNPTDAGFYGVREAFTNSYGGDYGSPLGSNYYDYHLLHLIRNNVSETNLPKNPISNSSLFLDGSNFTMNKYASQFVNGNKMNDGNDLGWEFSVSISGSGENAEAYITLTKI